MKDKRKFIITISWILVAIVAGFIFYMSACDATTSSEQSSKVVEVIEEIIFRDEEPPAQTEAFVRELAHGVEFLLLGIAVANACLWSGFKRRGVISVIICFLYAVSDEIHQIWIPGRVCDIKDVLIDSAGSVLGIILLLFVIRFIQKRKRKENV